MTQLLSRPTRAVASPVLPLDTRAGRADRTALVTADGSLTYAELAGRAAGLAADVLGPTRRLVLVEAANHVDAVVAYLAALQHGHAVLLVPAGRPEQRAALVETYDPDVVAGGSPDGWVVGERREDTAHDLHPDLALLLSTSGSTGSPKLVRLSADNVRSNAASIASYLQLGETDLAATSLPLHYCYGLSVLNSHLTAGAGLALTDLSVVDECFWDLFRESGATSFAGVPYTFDLLDRSGFAGRGLPSLRRVTQAGGRLAPETVRRYADLGRRRGWDLVVMYGQTEATARMAYLPPELATARPEAIGVPVPGGSLRLDPVPEASAPGTGELVYRGPNVMMGYADGPADLGLGRTVDELRTGDLGRLRGGLFEVVGRRNRQAKVFGLRLDLDRVEQHVSRTGEDVHCVAVGDVLHAFTDRPRAATRIHDDLAGFCGLPPLAVRVSVLATLPRTAAGKPDRAALERQAALVGAAAPGSDPGPPARVTPSRVRDELALVLGRPDAGVDSSFVGLGGDSLSYVELATRLSGLLGDLPAGWHTMTATELACSARRRSGPGVLVDTTVALRALAIFLVVATHANLLTVAGGAHLLLAVAGFNLARFQVGDLSRRTRVRHGLVAVAQVAVPSALFIGSVGLVTGMYQPATALFLNGVAGQDGWTVQWQFWFLEALVWLSLGAVALLAVPAVDRLERRAPYRFAVGLLAAGLVLRFAWAGLETGATERYTPAVVLWLVAAGWAAARATTHLQRSVVAVLAAVGVVGYFGDPRRELLVLAGVLALLWLPGVRLPRPVAAATSVLAAASLFVYLTHWQVYPHLELDHPWLATGLSLAVGVGYARAMRPLLRRTGRLRQPLSARS